MIKIPARELRAGDFIREPEGHLVSFHAVPFDKSQAFTAGYSNKEHSGIVTYEPDEVVEVLARWPDWPR